MPPIFMHMAMARDIEQSLDLPLLRNQLGAYLFGSTTPDIRGPFRIDRAHTHFFHLDVFDHQDSVAGLFGQHPRLADPEALPPETVAFLAGYITHLTLDERYICDVYRPFFGQQAALGGSQMANTMDRVLQFELDRRRREEPETAAAIREALGGCSLAIDVGFLSSEMLARWLEVAIDQTRHPPDWRRFRYQGGRHIAGMDLESEEALEEFIQRVPAILEQTINHVSTARVDAYIEQASERAATAIRRYLGEP